MDRAGANRVRNAPAAEKSSVLWIPDRGKGIKFPTMGAQQGSTDDPEATHSGGYVLGEDDTNPGRRAIDREELLVRLTAMIQACEGCENVRVIDVTRLDWPDKDGHNWSHAVVLDPFTNATADFR